jgi:RNA polymerase sigma factor (sigma-70 family)
MTQAADLEALARLALGGDRDALDRLARELQGDVYGLGLRMLWNREDAEDATQEILVRVVTRLSQFDFRSRLKTWVYRIAVNYVLDVKKSPTERLRLTFDRFGADLVDGLSSDGPSDAERSLLTEEVKIGCTLGMLQCLDRPHRIAYVLGDIMELPGPEVADILEISPDLFRKRLQHARATVLSFTREHCGVVCQPRCALAGFDAMLSILRRPRRPFTKRARPSVGWKRQSGHSRFTGRAIRRPPRSISPFAWQKRSCERKAARHTRPPHFNVLVRCTGCATLLHIGECAVVKSRNSRSCASLAPALMKMRPRTP